MSEQAPLHILRADQFSDQLLMDTVIEKAYTFRTALCTEAGKRDLREIHAGKILLNLYYEASTRTDVSSRMAASRLGMDVIHVSDAGTFSSAAKGESTEDTARVLSGYKPEAIAVRHDVKGAPEVIAKHSGNVPVVNSGDEKNEHPTQTALDIFTIFDKMERDNNLQIVVGGDINSGRTAKSLIRLLGQKQNSFRLVAPESNNADEDLQHEFGRLRSEFEYHYELTDETLRDADVVYWTRTQSERGAGQPDPHFNIFLDRLKYMNPDGILMHPGPRTSELSTDTDNDPRNVVNEQSDNGLPVRMAIFDIILDPSCVR